MTSSRRPDPHLRIRRDRFDDRKRELFGELPDYEVAARFGLHPSTFSLLLNGHIQPSPAFIADVLGKFGGVFEDWFVVPTQAQGSAA